MRRWYIVGTYILVMKTPVKADLEKRKETMNMGG